MSRTMRRTLAVLAVVLLDVAAPAGAEEMKPQVIGGSQVPSGQWRNVALIQIYDEFGDFVGACSGTLIARDVVLTAAHCEPQPWQSASAFVGADGLYDTTWEGFGVSRFVAHPSYVGSTHDIALAFLDGQSTVSPEMPIDADEEAGVRTGAAVTIVGWGTTEYESFPEYRHQASIPLLSSSECSAYSAGYDHTSHVCAGTPGVGGCYGDSGGPAFVTVPGAGRRIIGVTSYGASDCLSTPSYFTRVATFFDWMARHLVPYAPERVVAKATGSTAVVTWAPPFDGGSLVTSIEVAVGDAVVVVAPTATSASVRGLGAGTHMPVVRYRNAYGLGTPGAGESITIVPTGYVMADDNGSTFTFGDVQHQGNAPGQTTDVAVAPSGYGYWLLRPSGQVLGMGVGHFGDSGPLDPTERATSLLPTATGAGYWIVTSAGRVFPRGDALAAGDLSGMQLNGPIVDAARTKSGRGYYLLGSDGGIFSFGDAAFHGSTGAMRLNSPVVAMAPDPDGTGYWLISSDGGVFAFAAAFRGSMGGTPLNQPVIGAVPYGNGYLMVGSDGGIFTFSNQPFAGSLGGQPLARPIVAVAAPT